MSAAKRRIFEWVNTTPVENMTQRGMLRVLAEFADEKGETFRGQEAIAERAACHQVTVRRTFNALERLGLIEREHRYDRRGKRTSDIIRLCVAEALPNNVHGSEPTTVQSAPHYRAISSSLPCDLRAESTEESTVESSPLPPEGGPDGFSRDFSGKGKQGQKGGRRWRRKPEDVERGIAMGILSPITGRRMGTVEAAHNLMQRLAREGQDHPRATVPRAAHEIDGTLAPRGGALVPHVSQAVFEGQELVEAQADPEGHFVITRGCKSWEAWLEHTLEYRGQERVDVILSNAVPTIEARFKWPIDYREFKRSRGEPLVPYAETEAGKAEKQGKAA